MMALNYSLLLKKGNSQFTAWQYKINANYMIYDKWGKKYFSEAENAPEDVKDNLKKLKEGWDFIMTEYWNENTITVKAIVEEDREKYIRENQCEILKDFLLETDRDYERSTLYFVRHHIEKIFGDDPAKIKMIKKGKNSDWDKFKKLINKETFKQSTEMNKVEQKRHLDQLLELLMIEKDQDLYNLINNGSEEGLDEKALYKLTGLKREAFLSELEERKKRQREMEEQKNKIIEDNEKSNTEDNNQQGSCSSPKIETAAEEQTRNERIEKCKNDEETKVKEEEKNEIIEELEEKEHSEEKSPSLEMEQEHVITSEKSKKEKSSSAGNNKKPQSKPWMKNKNKKYHKKIKKSKGNNEETEDNKTSPSAAADSNSPLSTQSDTPSPKANFKMTNKKFTILPGIEVSTMQDVLLEEHLQEMLYEKIMFEEAQHQNIISKGENGWKLEQFGMLLNIVVLLRIIEQKFEGAQILMNSNKFEDVRPNYERFSLLWWKFKENPIDWAAKGNLNSLQKILQQTLTHLQGWPSNIGALNENVATFSWLKYWPEFGHLQVIGKDKKHPWEEEENDERQTERLLARLHFNEFALLIAKTSVEEERAKIVRNGNPVNHKWKGKEKIVGEIEEDTSSLVAKIIDRSREEQNDVRDIQAQENYCGSPASKFKCPKFQTEHCANLCKWMTLSVAKQNIEDIFDMSEFERMERNWRAILRQKILDEIIINELKKYPEISGSATFFVNPNFYLLSQNDNLLIGNGDEECKMESSLLKILDSSYANIDEKRKNEIEKATEWLGKLCGEWLNSISKELNFQTNGVCKIIITGSHLLQTATVTSDVDLLLVLPMQIRREHFNSPTFKNSFFNWLRIFTQQAYNNVLLNSVILTRTPLIELSLLDIKLELDIIFAPVPKERIEEDLDINHIKLINDNHQKEGIISLAGFQILKHLLAIVPDEKHYRALLKTVKLWTKSRQLNENVFGYLNGAALNLLCAKICLLYPNGSLPFLLQQFFLIFANWDWHNRPLIIESVLFTTHPLSRFTKLEWNLGNMREYFSSRKIGQMSIITPILAQNTVYNVNTFTRETILAEMNRALKIVSSKINDGISHNAGEKMTDWGDLFQPLDKNHQDFAHFFVLICGAEDEKQIYANCGGWKKDIRLNIYNFNNEFREKNLKSGDFVGEIPLRALPNYVKQKNSPNKNGEGNKFYSLLLVAINSAAYPKLTMPPKSDVDRAIELLKEWPEKPEGIDINVLFIERTDHRMKLF